MEKQKCHKEVHAFLRDAVAQELGTNPALGQPAGATKDRVLLLEPARRKTIHCSTHIPKDPKHPFGIQQERREGQKSVRNMCIASEAQGTWQLLKFWGTKGKCIHPVLLFVT